MPSFVDPLGRRHLIALAGASCLGLAGTPARAQSARSPQVLRDLGVADGTGPQSLLCRGRDGLWYGTSSFGGTAGWGTLFRLAADGSGYTVLHDFRGGTDGANPYSGVIVGPDGRLYGTTLYGGASGRGTVYTFDPASGGGVTVLHAFSGAGGDGANPQKALCAGPDGRLYGVSFGGGGLDRGTAFVLGTQGGLSVIHVFDGSLGRPTSALVVGPDGALYGTAAWDGAPYVSGTVYRLAPGGAVNVVFSFDDFSDGAQPNTLLASRDGLLYGTCRGGGLGGQGTLFQLAIDGSFSVLYRYGRRSTDGLWPTGLVEASDGRLYGTLRIGGPQRGGTLYRSTRTGQTTLLHAFSDTGTGPRYPSAGVAQGGAALFGTTEYGGATGGGTVFRF